MKKAVSRFLPLRSNSERSFTKPFKLDGINLIHDFYIEVDEPHKTWAPGETITGSAVLDLKKNITEVNITLILVGIIKMKLGQTTTNVRKKRTVLFRHTSVIYGFDKNETSQREDSDEPTIGLSRGEHRFPFSVKLPKKNIYTSISFEKGSISYSLRASINHNQPSDSLASLTSSPSSELSSSATNFSPYPKNSIHHCKKNINIVVPINVTKIPKPQTKYASLKITDRKLFKTMSSTSTINSNATHSTNNSDNSNDSGSNVPVSPSMKDYALVRLAVDLPQSGFLRGEIIPVKIKVFHYKPIQSSSGIIVTLIRVCRVDSGPETPIQSFRKDLCQTIAPLYIDPATLTAEISTSLRVPVDAFPTIVGSDMVTFQYYIEVLANVSNKNIIRSGSSQTAKKAPSKFSHTIMFDLDQQHDHMTLVEDGMVNVDNIKRAKNMLGLNTEIIVGTERIKKHKNVGKKTILSNARQQNADVNNELLLNDSECSFIEGMSTASISPISISRDVNSPAGQISVVACTSMVSTGQEIHPPDINHGLSEKEILRRNEDALLPSEPVKYGVESPLPSYDYEESNTEYSAPPMSHHYGVGQVIVDQSSDKAELERRRLIEMESEPPEFDYVPEYDPAGQDYRTETSSPTLSSHVQYSNGELDTLRG
jgi:hypothetical protein